MNNNCLEGIRCPECGFEDKFEIHAETVFEVTDDGTGDYEGVDWRGTSACTCTACGHSGTVNDFYIEGYKEPVIRIKSYGPNGWFVDKLTAPLKACYTCKHRQYHNGSHCYRSGSVVVFNVVTGETESPPIRRCQEERFSRHPEDCGLSGRHWVSKDKE